MTSKREFKKKIELELARSIMLVDYWKVTLSTLNSCYLKKKIG